MRVRKPWSVKQSTHKHVRAFFAVPLQTGSYSYLRIRGSHFVHSCRSTTGKAIPSSCTRDQKCERHSHVHCCFLLVNWKLEQVLRSVRKMLVWKVMVLLEISMLFQVILVTRKSVLFPKKADFFRGVLNYQGFSSGKSILTRNIRIQNPSLICMWAKACFLNRFCHLHPWAVAKLACMAG